MADLLIIMGTSLTVHPFASLVNRVPSDCPRVLINLDRVGGIGSRTDDVVVLGKCDDVVKELCELLGWGDELEKAWAETAERVEVGEGESVPVPVTPKDSGIEEAERKVERLARELEKLMVSDKEKPTSEETTTETEKGPVPLISKDEATEIKAEGAVSEIRGPTQSNKGQEVSGLEGGQVKETGEKL